MMNHTLLTVQSKSSDPASFRKHSVPVSNVQLRGRVLGIGVVVKGASSRINHIHALKLIGAYYRYFI